MSNPEKLCVSLDLNHSGILSAPIMLDTTNCDNVHDFIKVVKKKMFPPRNKVGKIKLCFTQNGPAIRSDVSLSDLPVQPGFVRNSYESPIIVTISTPASTLVSNVSFNEETILVKEEQEVWENIPVDESIAPSPEFIQLSKKYWSKFDFVEMLLREVESQFSHIDTLFPHGMMHFVDDGKQPVFDASNNYTVYYQVYRYLPHMFVMQPNLRVKKAMLQCVGECLSIHYRQKAAGMSDLCVYGLYSNGTIWNFVYVSQDGVVKVSEDYVLDVHRWDVDHVIHLYRVVHYVMQQSLLNNPDLDYKIRRIFLLSFEYSSRG